MDSMEPMDGAVLEAWVILMRADLERQARLLLVIVSATRAAQEMNAAMERLNAVMQGTSDSFSRLAASLAEPPPANLN